MRKLDGFYEVSYDSDRKLLRISTYGFWNLDVVDQFGRAIEEVTRIADPMCDTIVNTCRTEIHSTEVSEALGRISYSHKDSETGRNADATYGYFETEQEALDWLATPAQPAASPARAAG